MEIGAVDVAAGGAVWIKRAASGATCRAVQAALGRAQADGYGVNGTGAARKMLGADSGTKP